MSDLLIATRSLSIFFSIRINCVILCLNGLILWSLDQSPTSKKVGGAWSKSAVYGLYRAIFIARTSAIGPEDHCGKCLGLHHECSHHVVNSALVVPTPSKISVASVYAVVGKLESVLFDYVAICISCCFMREACDYLDHLLR